MFNSYHEVCVNGIYWYTTTGRGALNTHTQYFQKRATLGSKISDKLFLTCTHTHAHKLCKKVFILTCIHNPNIQKTFINKHDTQTDTHARRL